MEKKIVDICIYVYFIIITLGTLILFEIIIWRIPYLTLFIFIYLLVFIQNQNLSKKV